MEIKTHYYYRSKEGVLKDGGEIVFNRGRILSVQGREISEKGIPFYSTSVNDVLKLEVDEKTVRSVLINRIITEKEYTSTQMEYYIRLDWINQQKFKWMNKRHILQQKKTLIHLGLIAVLIYFVYLLLQILTD